MNFKKFTVIFLGTLLIFHVLGCSTKNTPEFALQTPATIKIKMSSKLIEINGNSPKMRSCFSYFYQSSTSILKTCEKKFTPELLKIIKKSDFIELTYSNNTKFSFIEDKNKNKSEKDKYGFTMLKGIRKILIPLSDILPNSWIFLNSKNELIKIYTTSIFISRRTLAEVIVD